MRSILKRLSDKKGETLVESLASILIFTFASILFLSMVSSATSINATAKASDERLQTEQLALEQAESPSQVDAKIICDGNTLATVKVNLIAPADSDGLFAFYPVSGQEGG